MRAHPDKSPIKKNTTQTIYNEEFSFYCATDDGEHFNEFGQTNSIFDALCSYYDSVNNPEEGELEVEIGYHEIVDNQIDDYIPLLYHSFEEED